MTSPQSTDLPVFSRGRMILEARRIERTQTSDLILYWSTKLGPYQFYKKCSSIEHEPSLRWRIDIIADDDIVQARDDAGLKKALADRSLVRFNFANWSVTWLASSHSATAEIQATVDKPPSAMTEMIKQSITGFTAQDVERFFEHLKQVA